MIETFAALADSNRLRILELLRKKPLAVGELVERLEIPQPQVSKHLKVLKEAGLVDVTRDAQWRRYELRAKPLQEVDRWLAKFRA